MQRTITHSRYIIHPFRFNLWIAIVTMIMMFAAFTSAYIVKKGNVNWAVTSLPQLFTYSTIVIVASSVMMHMAYISFRKNNVYRYRVFIVITTLLGATFLTMQIFNPISIIIPNILTYESFEKIMQRIYNSKQVYFEENQKLEELKGLLLGRMVRN